MVYLTLLKSSERLFEDFFAINCYELLTILLYWYYIEL